MPNLRYIDHSNILLGVLNTPSKHLSSSSLRSIFLEARSSPSLTFELLLRVFVNENKFFDDDSYEYVDALSFLIHAESNKEERKKCFQKFARTLLDIGALEVALQIISSYETRFMNDVIQDASHHILVGQVNYQSGRIVEAKSRYLKALPYSKQNVECFLGLSSCYFSNQEYNLSLQVSRLFCFLDYCNDRELQDRIFQSFCKQISSTLPSFQDSNRLIVEYNDDREVMDSYTIKLGTLHDIFIGNTKLSNDILQVAHQIVRIYDSIEPNTLTIFGDHIAQSSVNARIASSIDVSFLVTELMRSAKEKRPNLTRNGRSILAIDWNMDVPSFCLLELAFYSCIVESIRG
jgi:hypothetical protein